MGWWRDGTELYVGKLQVSESTGLIDWDEYESLPCNRYITSFCDAIEMTSYKTMFRINAFDARGELEI